ncbi:hypothetical protein MRX96_039201 [Rhipicephalus microplus]
MSSMQCNPPSSSDSTDGIDAEGFRTIKGNRRRVKKVKRPRYDSSGSSDMASEDRSRVDGHRCPIRKARRRALGLDRTRRRRVRVAAEAEETDSLESVSSRSDGTTSSASGFGDLDYKKLADIGVHVRVIPPGSSWQDSSPSSSEEISVEDPSSIVGGCSRDATVSSGAHTSQEVAEEASRRAPQEAHASSEDVIY